MTTTSKRWVFIAIFLVLAVIAALISTKYYSSAAGISTGGRALKRGSVQTSPEPYRPAQRSARGGRGTSPEPYQPVGTSPEPY